MGQDLAAAAVMGLSGMGSSLIESGGGGDEDKGLEALKYKDPQRALWALQMARQYPKLKELGLGPETLALVSRMMKGQLPEGVEQAYGAGAEREYGGQLASLADIGAGPATLALARRGVMQGLGERIAQARGEAVKTGLAAAPTAYMMGMQPYEAERKKWADITNMYLQTPGAAYAGRGIATGNLPFGTELPTIPGYEPVTDIPAEIFKTQPPVTPPGQTRRAFGGNSAAVALRRRILERQPGYGYSYPGYGYQSPSSSYSYSPPSQVGYGYGYGPGYR